MFGLETLGKLFQHTIDSICSMVRNCLGCLLMICSYRFFLDLYLVIQGSCLFRSFRSDQCETYCLQSFVIFTVIHLFFLFSSLLPFIYCAAFAGKTLQTNRPVKIYFQHSHDTRTKQRARQNMCLFMTIHTIGTQSVPRVGNTGDGFIPYHTDTMRLKWLGCKLLACVQIIMRLASDIP